MSIKIRKLVILFVALSIIIPSSALAMPSMAPQQVAGDVSFTILHTNDFHGQLVASGSNPGLARVATVVNDVRTAVGADKVLLVDAGDEMQGSLLSNLQKGVPVIAAFNEVGYNLATFGNHEFDWGQTVLGDRTSEANYPYITANIVKAGADGNCDGWTTPDFATAPYKIETVAGVKVGFIGVTTTETPTITIASATEGLCFKDPTESIEHYYDAMKADGAQVMVVISHLGLNDGGYGYGLPVYGDKTLAQNLIDDDMPVDLIIGGHSHTNMLSLTPPGAVVVDDKTTVTQAYYNGRQVGRADIVYNTVSGAVTITWNALATAAAAPNPDVDALINTYATDPEYLALINQPIGYTAVDLPRDYNGDNMMGDFVDDAIYNYLNNDDTTTNDIDMFFNNAGGIRTDWCSIEDPLNPGTYIWSSTAADCKPGIYTHDPMLLTYGNMFNILPFGNATVVGTMTGAQILDLLDQSATLFKGAIQPSGIRYKFYRYQDAGTTYAWGAYDACVVNRVTHLCDPLDVNKTYRVGTNEFLAPAGQDGYLPFKYLTNLSYWGDMLDAVNAYVSTANGTPVTAYKGPNKDGLLDGRITRVGDDAGGAIIPVTILHHNDSHGNLVKGTYVGYDQLATIINQERAHNPDRTILLNGGDDIQGDALSYYFKTAAQGMTSDGTPLPAALSINPNIAVLNQMGYTALVLGNHEFNFGPTVFDTTFLQAKFPILGANLSDSGAYGIAKLSDMSASAADAIAAGKVPVHDDITVNLPSGDPNNPIWVAILGLTNPRVPNYELPSNIPGLTFSDPIQTAKDLVPDLRANNDVVVALTHIGFTSDPNSIDYDPWVDTNLASEVSGIDAIIGAHSHTNPKYGDGEYKYLPAIIGSPADQPVIVNQAYRYNNTLGEVVLGLLPKAGGGFEVVTRAGKYISVTMDTPQDPAIDAIVDPYLGLLAAYNNTVLGETTVPIDALDAFTQETNAANLQADASVYELEQHDIIPDVHISGAMTNKKVANSATVATPYTLKVSDMFSLMPYENSLVMLRMNGPQIKAVLERGYRNYWYYKNVPDGYGGYSHYTTCMLDTNSAGKITYSDDPAVPPNGNNVVSFTIDGKAVDFNDAETYYNVSTVNYLAAGSCNFNDNGVSLWPLDQIENDTQFYVRDAVIDYIKAQTEPIAPAIEGRLEFLLQAFRYFFLPILIK